MAEDDFCERCDVSLDLHSDGGREEWDCDIAGRKVALMDAFYGMFTRLPLGAASALPLKETP